MRRRVSGATPTLNQFFSKAVTVRQAPVVASTSDWICTDGYLSVGGYICREIGHQFRTIDTDAITQLHIGQDCVAIGDGQRRTPAPAC